MSASLIKNPKALPGILAQVNRARLIINGGNGNIDAGKQMMGDIVRELEANGYTRRTAPKTFELIDFINAELAKR